jgi:hypothetical protein
MSCAGDDILDDAQVDHQTTWADRNPDLDVQPSRSRAKAAKLSNAEENTRNLGKAARKVKNTELAADIDALNLERAAQIEALATKYHRKPTYVTDIINNTTHYKKTRAPNLQNALLHHKAMEMNEGTSLNSS